MITCLRVVACILVTMVHTQGWITWNSKMVGNIAERGQDGLWVFMLLSGYLVYYSYMNNMDGYFKKRALRLCPAYWGWLTVLLLYSLTTGVFTQNWFDWLRAYAYCILIIPSTDFNGMYGLGRMSSFFVFYLIFPILYRKTKSMDMGICLLFLFYAINIITPGVLKEIFKIWPVQSNMDFIGITPLADLSIFWVGFLIAKAEQETEKLKLMVALVISYVLMERVNIGLSYIPMVGIVVALLLYVPIKLPNLLVKCCRFVTPITFTLYLCHPSMYAYVGQYYPQLSNNSKLILMYGLSVVAAVLLHYLLEVPIEKIVKVRHYKDVVVSKQGGGEGRGQRSLNGNERDAEKLSE